MIKWSIDSNFNFSFVFYFFYKIMYICTVVKKVLNRNVSWSVVLLIPDFVTKEFVKMIQIFFFSNFGFFLKFAKNNNYHFIDTMLYFRFVSSDVSNCIVLKFMCAKFQVSSSKKQGSYWYLNMGHLLKSPSIKKGFSQHIVL